jgi:hypothetical protein
MKIWEPWGHTRNMKCSAKSSGVESARRSNSSDVDGTRGTARAMARGDGERYCAPHEPCRARFVAVRSFHPPIPAPVRRLRGRSARRGPRPQIPAMCTFLAWRSTRASSLLGASFCAPVRFRRPSWPNRPSRAKAAGRRARRLRQLALGSLRRPAVRFAHPRPARSPAPPPPSPRRRPSRLWVRTVRRRRRHAPAVARERVAPRNAAVKALLTPARLDRVAARRLCSW